MVREVRCWLSSEVEATRRLGDGWYLDEIFLRINGKLQYLWRAVDQDGDVLDILIEPQRDQ